jgi:L-fuculose-phosphate aldolase
MSKNSIENIGERIRRGGRKLHDHGLVRGTSGNISARIPGTDTFMIKPSGARMEALDTEELVFVDLQGRKIKGKLNVSLETPMHAAIYRSRKDVQAVVHTHPPTATAFGIAKTAIMPLQIEMFMLLPNGVPVVPFKMPGSKALAKAVQKNIADCNAIILENHGIVTVGPTIEAACNLNEIVEEAAKIQLSVMTLGGKNVLSLTELKEKFKKQNTVK